METKFEFKATGGDLLKKMLLGGLLVGITFGIYYPWFLVDMWKTLLAKTRMRVGDRDVRLSYDATGGQLFKELFLSYLFTIWSFGIYLPWAIVRLTKFQQEHLLAMDDERTYRLRSRLEGGELFKAGLVGYLLTAITLGIYAPWFLCKMAKLFVERTELVDEEGTIGKLRFELTGGELFKTAFVGYLLTMVTFGIYMFWFQVKLAKLFLQKTEIRIGETAYRGDFTATGGEAFKTVFVGYLFTIWSFGIYLPWFVVRLMKFQLEHLRFAPVGEVELTETLEESSEGELVARVPSPRPEQARRPSPAPAPARKISPVPSLSAERRPSSAPAVRRARRPSAVPAPVPATRAERRPAAPAKFDRTEQNPVSSRSERSERSERVGDRRATWAQAFLPALDVEQAAADVLSEGHETLPHPMTIQDLAEVWTDSLSAQAPLPRSSSVN